MDSAIDFGPDFFKKCEITAKAHGRPDLIDDFTQWLALYWLQNNKRDTMYTFRFKDFIQAKYGLHYKKLKQQKNTDMDKFIDAKQNNNNDAFSYVPHGTIERSLVILKYKWGFTYQEISEVLGIPKKTLQNKMCLLKKYLKTKH